MWSRSCAYQGGRKFLVASHQGNGFVVAEDECLGNTRKGKQVLNVKAPDEAARDDGGRRRTRRRRSATTARWWSSRSTRCRR